MIRNMIPFRKSIGFRLLGISVILLAFPLLVDSFILIQQRYQHTIAHAKEYLIETAQLRALPLSQIHPLNKSLLEVIAYSLNLRNAFPQKENDGLNERLSKIAKIGDFTAVSLLKITDNQEYVVVASSFPNLIGKNETDFFKQGDLFSTQSLEKGYTTYITFSNQTLEPYFIVAHVIVSPKEEKPIGVLMVEDDISGKLKELLYKERHPYPVNFALLLPSSIVFAASDPNLHFQYFEPLKPTFLALFKEEEPAASALLPNLPLKVDNKIGYPFFEFQWNKESYIGYLKELGDANFTLLAYASKKEIFASPVINFFNIYSVYGLILLIGGTGAYLLTLRMARPMRDLSGVMLGIQRGEFDLRYQRDPWGFEINDLGHIFNEMLDALFAQKKRAEEERIKKEIFAKELRLGQQAQRSLLPQTMPKYPRVDVAEIYIPAIEVGGDFYDVFVKTGENNHEELVLAIADASGKGVQACFYSLSIRNMLRTYVKEKGDVGMAMSKTNNLFRLDTGETGMFVTIFVGIYDYLNRSFHYFSAGHNPAIVRRKTGEIEILTQHGIAMGFVATGEQHGLSITLEEGDTVILYTDGITEAHNEAFELYGEERLIALIQKEGGNSAKDLAEKIVDEVNAFAGTAPQHDDITLLVMKTL